MDVKEFLPGLKFFILFMQQLQLPFASDALEPYIDQATIDIHYGKHHATYLANLNKIVSEEFPNYTDKSIEEILLDLNTFPESRKTAILNNAGQVFNHDLYWQSLSADHDQTPTGELLEAINSTFGTVEEFTKLWKEAGLTQFGSGWVWLSLNEDNKLVIDKTSNADSPLLHGKHPIMTMDVWEHAYYLKYQNKRGDYIDNYFKVVDWEAVLERFEDLQ